MKEFPKYWYMEITSDIADVVNEWKQEKNPNSLHAKECNYVSSQGARVSGGTWRITFNQFKQFVLKEDVMDEIIGYKFKEEQSNEKLIGWAHIGLLHSEMKDPSKKNILRDIFENEKVRSHFEKLDLMDKLFEPVYAPRYALPKIGRYSGEKLSRCRVKYGCKTIGLSFVKNALALGITSIAIEGENVFEADLRQIVEYFDNM